MNPELITLEGECDMGRSDDFGTPWNVQDADFVYEDVGEVGLSGDDIDEALEETYNEIVTNYPELMGARTRFGRFFKRVFQRIGERIRERRKREGNLEFNMPWGDFRTGEGGTMYRPYTPPPPPPVNQGTELLKNPIVLGIGALLAFKLLSNK